MATPSKGKLKSWKEKAHAYFHKFMMNPHSEHSIGLGFAIGTFINVIPTFGLSIILALIIMLLFRKVNRVSLLAALVFWNPITLPPVYVASGFLGVFLMDWIPFLQQLVEKIPLPAWNIPFLSSFFSTGWKFLLGNAVLAVVLTIGSYWATRLLVRWYRREQEQHTILRMDGGKKLL